MIKWSANTLRLPQIY